jgi:HSP20 family protein
MLTLYRRPNYSRRWRRSYPMGFNGGTRLPVDIQVENDEFVITAPVAGLKPEDLKIEILDDVLTLTGEVKSESNGEEDYLLREIHYGEFSRSFRLPSSVEADKAEAKVEDGMLTVRLPKVEEERPKKIEVKAK